MRNVRAVWTTETVHGKFVIVFHNKGKDVYVLRFYANGKHMDASDEPYLDRAEAISRANHVMEAEREESP